MLTIYSYLFTYSYVLEMLRLFSSAKIWKDFSLLISINSKCRLYWCILHDIDVKWLCCFSCKGRFKAASQKCHSHVRGSLPSLQTSIRAYFFFFFKERESKRERFLCYISIFHRHLVNISSWLYFQVCFYVFS